MNCMCFCLVRDGVIRPRHIWQIHAWKWFGDLLTQSEEAHCCGSWLTLERRQPVSLTFSFTPPPLSGAFFLSFFHSCQRKWGGRCTIWHENHRGCWPHLQRIMPNTCQQLVTIWKSPRLLKSILTHYDKWLKITMRYVVLEIDWKRWNHWIYSAHTHTHVLTTQQSLNRACTLHFTAWNQYWMINVRIKNVYFLILENLELQKMLKHSSK